MITNSGKLDRRIVIEQVTETRDAYGGIVETWATFATMWAQVVPTNVNEIYNADALRAFKMTTFTVRWREGLDPKMRIQFDGHAYRILGVKEVGRRDFIDILTESVE